MPPLLVLDDGVPVYHSVGSDFLELIRRALGDLNSIVAYGPIYDEDPAHELAAPFLRSAKETGWKPTINDIVPDSVASRMDSLRLDALKYFAYDDRDDLYDWTRSALVLEIATRAGIRVLSQGTIHPKWRLNATETGRFGVESTRLISGGTFNPMSLPKNLRERIVASDHTRMVAVLDFRAMDVCSMIALIPGLRKMFADHPDPHQRVAEITGLQRSEAKISFLTWAYGGVVDPHILDVLSRNFRCITAITHGLPHGDFARAVQRLSARAFRAGLSRALPLLVDGHLLPMFTVHDELTLDVSEIGQTMLTNISKALEEGASQRIGSQYIVGRAKTGYTYEAAKNGV